MIGAVITPTGTPAAESVSIARDRAAGMLVRGSISRASSASSYVGRDKVTVVPMKATSPDRPFRSNGQANHPAR